MYKAVICCNLLNVFGARFQSIPQLVQHISISMQNFCPKHLEVLSKSTCPIAWLPLPATALTDTTAACQRAMAQVYRGLLGRTVLALKEESSTWQIHFRLWIPYTHCKGEALLETSTNEVAFCPTAALCTQDEGVHRAAHEAVRAQLSCSKQGDLENK